MKKLIAAALLVCSMHVSSAEKLDLATEPLGKEGAAPVPPNLMVVLDDSGSMDQYYTPDWVMDTNMCRSRVEYQYSTTSATNTTCNVGEVPYHSGDFNKQFYNPKIRYLPPMRPDGSEYPNASVTATPGNFYQPFTQYGSNWTTNLTNNRTEDAFWCKSQPSSSQMKNSTWLSNNCKKIGAGQGYIYPDNTYKYKVIFDEAPFYGPPFYYVMEGSLPFCKTTTSTDCSFNRTETYKYPRFTAVTFKKVYITPSVSSYTKYPARTDCAGSSCSYAEELQNYANWYAYYQYRMNMMKTALSRALSQISDTRPGVGFRVGLMVISGGATHQTGTDYKWNRDREVPVGEFDVTQKDKVYNSLFAMRTPSWTPLRGALSRVGKYYANKMDKSESAKWPDPVKYSCQQNFTLLSTDGYWNTQIEKSSGPNFGPYKEDGNLVGDVDGDANRYQRPAVQSGTSAESNTLADVAAYFYGRDIRGDMENEVPASDADEQIFKKSWLDAQDPSFRKRQRMTTYTLGLGVDGSLVYHVGYKEGLSLDYNAIMSGAKTWPKTASSEENKIDDLWHAAVNGGGRYLSAATPDSLYEQLVNAFNDIGSQVGSASAAATSNLALVAGSTNLAYLPRYNVKGFDWNGDILALPMDPDSGETKGEADAVWSARANLQAKAEAGARTLYTLEKSATGSDKKKPLTFATLTPAEKAYFSPAQLGQCGGNPGVYCPGATAENLFDFLMGKKDPTPTGSYRAREYALGDIVNSAPVFVAAPYFKYADEGYEDFKQAQKSRRPVLYAGANDGFLHAFDGNTGEEIWAYMPSAVLPDVYLLANKSYAHRYFVDGKITVGDAYNSGWRTVLVAGLGAGGRQYFALDVTDPNSPKVLWEFSDPTLGFAYGNPIITKLPDTGQWVALLTSGYNGGDKGQGVLYAVDLFTGVEVFRIKTNSSLASVDNPIGLARINNWRKDANVNVDAGVANNNTTLAVYGGDLNGDLWRFDLESRSVSLVARLGEPITVAPELASVKGHRVIFLGTGIWLQVKDKADRAIRTVYAIKDSLGGTITSIKGSANFVEQVITQSGTSRTSSSAVDMDWDTKQGWYATLIEDGERVNVDPWLTGTLLAVASNVPDAGTARDCAAGGKSWFNVFDVLTGKISTTSTTYFGDTLIVGISGFTTATGQPRVLGVGADGRNRTLSIDWSAGTPQKQSRRVSWRELIPRNE